MVGTEIFDQKKPSTYQAGSNEVSFVHIWPVVQKLLRYKGKNLWPFIYIEILGLQCLFFRAICQMCAVVAFLYFFDYNSIYSGMPNVFYLGCNARFSERCAIANMFFWDCNAGFF